MYLVTWYPGGGKKEEEKTQHNKNLPFLNFSYSFLSFLPTCELSPLFFFLSLVSLFSFLQGWCTCTIHVQVHSRSSFLQLLFVFSFIRKITCPLFLWRNILSHTILTAARTNDNWYLLTYPPMSLLEKFSSRGSGRLTLRKEVRAGNNECTSTSMQISFFPQ